MGAMFVYLETGALRKLKLNLSATEGTSWQPHGAASICYHGQKFVQQVPINLSEKVAARNLGSLTGLHPYSLDRLWSR
jgi:hypothetical protein